MDKKSPVRRIKRAAGDRRGKAAKPMRRGAAKKDLPRAEFLDGAIAVLQGFSRLADMAGEVLEQQRSEAVKGRRKLRQASR